jgi:hypothetical protein
MDPTVESKPKLLISAWSLQLSALLLNVIGTGTPYWIYKSALYASVYAGLWQKCVQIFATTTIAKCNTTDGDPGNISCLYVYIAKPEMSAEEHYDKL